MCHTTHYCSYFELLTITAIATATVLAKEGKAKVRKAKHGKGREGVKEDTCVLVTAKVKQANEC